MSFFECCHQCKAPKRHPGCHSKCPDYIKQKEAWEACKEAERKRNMVLPAKTDYLSKAIWFKYKR